MPSLHAEDIQMLADSVDRYVDQATDSAQDSAAQWRDFSELGWLRLVISNENGGLDGGAAGLAALMRGVGRGLIAAPLVSSAVLGATILAEAGNAAQMALLEAVLSGEATIALADREARGGHARGWAETRAARVDGGYRFVGTKVFVADYSLATQIIVSARIEGEDRVTLFLVDRDGAALDPISYTALDGRETADIHFNGAFVPETGRLPGDAQAALDAAYEIATIAVCAEAAGITAALNAMTLDYLKTRRQFGVPIGSFQVLQHRMVDMTVDEYELTAVLERAIALHDAEDPDAARWISAAKVLVGKAGRRVAEAALQLHGGMGMTDELRVGHYLKRLLVIGSQFGDADWHMDRIVA